VACTGAPAVHRNIGFALAVADLLELPDDLPLMAGVTAALSVPICLSYPGSLAHLKAVAHSAAREAMHHQNIADATQTRKRSEA
jgi:hypothetical protein